MIEAHRKVLDLIDPGEMISLLEDIVNIPSPTGKEAGVAEYLVRRFRALGLRGFLQEISPGRYNAIGALRGRGDGVSLLFNGHMDTSYSGEEEELQGVGYKPRMVRDKEWLYGLGVNNMKSGLAAFYGAVAALRRAGVELRGDITIAGVAGEIEKAPVDGYQGIEYAGYGAGTKYLVGHGVTADLCIMGEPSGLKIAAGHMGSLWTKITTRGTVAHTAFLDKARIVHAIEKAMKVASAIQEWIPRYRAAHEFMGERPTVNLAAIQGGWPWRAARTPASCSLYLDIRTTHEQNPMDVKRELQRILNELHRQDPELEADLEFYVTNPGMFLPPDAYVSRVVARAHQQVVGEPPEVFYRGPCTDATHLQHAGIPTVIYGAGGRVREEGVLGWSRDVGE
ncbi:MAG: M20/M25/M40 family metallo-hydrolase [Deltaproteobacteria bacterium]|nr:M20/M25/M40 family metallo-hydrolase [Deltaproteobacteria bacterium]